MTKFRFNLKNVALIVACFAVGSLLLVSGCKKDDKKDDSGDTTLTGIKFEQSAITLAVGRTQTLKAVAIPADTVLPSCTFVSDKKDIATIDGDGKVTGVAKGKATITVTADKFSATCEVTVTGGSSEEIYREPYMIWGVPMETIKDYEKRELCEENPMVLYYCGENANVESVSYFFGGEKKLWSAEIWFNNTTDIENRVVEFLKTKYEFKEKDELREYWFISSDEKTIVWFAYFVCGQWVLQYIDKAKWDEFKVQRL
ncbi:MAG: Ig-like domain-containing protein [Dysgonamonadaceae bacterium]|jgi:hypothetical protein|nr:Ig-like domain-containing protein [Dysgonamonadaceae bacterium]